MSVETLSAPTGISAGPSISSRPSFEVGPSIEPSIGSSFSPGLVSGHSGGSICREPLSSIMAIPELKISPSDFINEGPSPIPAIAFDERLTTTLWTIESAKTPDIPPRVHNLPFHEPEPKTEIAPIAREMFHGSIEIKVPDPWIAPLPEQDYDGKPATEQFEPTPESFAVMTKSPAQDTVEDVQTVNEIVGTRQKTAEVPAPAPAEPQAEWKSIPDLITSSQEGNTVEPQNETETITTQEQEADTKLAVELKTQIETNPDLSPEQKLQLVSQVDTIVEVKESEQSRRPKAQTREVLEPQEITQTATQVEEKVEEIKQEIPIQEPWWDINTVKREITVDEEGALLDTKTDIKHEGKIPQHKLENRQEN